MRVRDGQSLGNRGSSIDENIDATGDGMGEGVMLYFIQLF